MGFGAPVDEVLLAVGREDCKIERKNTDAVSVCFPSSLLFLPEKRTIGKPLTLRPLLPHLRIIDRVPFLVRRPPLPDELVPAPAEDDASARLGLDEVVPVRHVVRVLKGLRARVRWGRRDQSALGEAGANTGTSKETLTVEERD